MGNLGLRLGFVTVACLFLHAPLLAASCASTQTPPQSTANAPKPPEAFITSERVVYRAGRPVDLTFAVNTGKGTLVPGFEVTNEAGEVMALKEVGGKSFGEATATATDGYERTGEIASERKHVEKVADLAEWYAIEQPGLYHVTFSGTWTDAEQAEHPVTSNRILVKIVEPADGAQGEDEAEIEGQEIPLADIWALNMPGTRTMDDARLGSEPGAFRSGEGQWTSGLKRFLSSTQQINKPARAGFVVPATGLDAIRQAHDVIVNEYEAPTNITESAPITLVFFTNASGVYIHISHICIHGSLVTITYDIVPHSEANATVHLALIPFLPDRADTINVEIRPSAANSMATSHLWGEYSKRIVSHSFSFSIHAD